MPASYEPPPHDPVPPPGQTDEVEHIPWSHITVNGPARPAWQSPAAIALTVVALLGVLAFRMFLATPAQIIEVDPSSVVSGSTETLAAAPEEHAMDEPATVTVAPPTSESSPSTVVESVGAVRDGATSVVAAPPPAGTYSEADLLAYVPVVAEVVARARAEWFVRDYFSSTDGNRRDNLEAALADGVDVPRFSGDGLSYADWVRAYDVRSGHDDRHYVVTVLVGSLTLIESGYATTPIKAVEVEVVVDPDGASVVIDLPTPVPLPATADVVLAERVNESLPAEMAADLVEELGLVVANPAIVETQRLGTGWRVVFDSTDKYGVVTTYAITIDDATDE